MASPSVTLRLRLYVAGNAPNSVRAQGNLRAICVAHFDGAWKLEIVDVLREPKRALADGIIVTPMLLKLSPPTARLAGDLSDTSQVVLALRGS